MKNKFSSFFILGILLFLLTFPTILQAQNHRLLVHWGWNRAYYTKSDIQLKGSGYDLRLKNVIAKDRQTPFSFDVYFHPTKLSIPQTNAGFTYFLNENYSIALNIDHMKYVVQTNQEVNVEGSVNIDDHPYQGLYNDDVVKLTPDFFRMEHTDGLNYIVVEAARNDNLLKRLNNKLTDRLELLLVEGVGLGLIVPRTDVQVLGLESRNQYHLSGFGASANIGLQLIGFKYVFLKYNVKGGYINLNNILTSNGKTDKAKQEFWFFQRSFQFGAVIPFGKRL